MADYGLYKNSEGYSDPTAAEAIKGMAKPGEIWKYKGKEVLIISNQGVFCNILMLSDDPDKDKTAIGVAGRYTIPGMLSYAFNSLLGAKVERISDEDFNCVLIDIEAAIGIPLAKATEFCNKLSTETVLTERNALLESENTGLKKKLAFVRGMYNDLLDKFIEKYGEERA